MQAAQQAEWVQTLVLASAQGVVLLAGGCCYSLTAYMLLQQVMWGFSVVTGSKLKARHLRPKQCCFLLAMSSIVSSHEGRCRSLLLLLLVVVVVAVVCFCQAPSGLPATLRTKHMLLLPSAPTSVSSCSCVCSSVC